MSDKATPPERIWTQLYSPAEGYGLRTISAYDRDPREVHDNGKPVYEYVRDVSSVNSAPAAEELYEGAKMALKSLETLAKIDSESSGVDVEICEYKGTKELRAAIAAYEKAKEMK